MILHNVECLATAFWDAWVPYNNSYKMYINIFLNAQENRGRENRLSLPIMAVGFLRCVNSIIVPSEIQLLLLKSILKNVKLYPFICFIYQNILFMFFLSSCSCKITNFPEIYLNWHNLSKQNDKMRYELEFQQWCQNVMTYMGK